MPRNPIQPLIKDSHGTVRFQENAIVRYLLDNGGIDLNKLAAIDFSQNDREQFAMLIGYSLSGSSELSYMSNETYNAALLMAEKKMDEKDARIEALECILEAVRDGLKIAVPAVFNIHPDDLEN